VDLVCDTLGGTETSPIVLTQESVAKSFRSLMDENLIEQDEEFFRINDAGAKYLIEQLNLSR
jgi:predicted transcriptional regulator